MRAWQLCVTRLARGIWMLDTSATNTVLMKIEDLIADDAVTDSSVAEVLHGVGVSPSTAAMTAPTIRGASTL